MRKGAHNMMLYALVKAYKFYLLESYRPATAGTYCKRLALLLQGQSFTDPVGNLNIDKVLGKLEQIKYKNHFSQAKNAFLHFCKFQGISLSIEAQERIEKLEEKTKKKRRKLKPIEYSEIDKKIKYIRDTRLKLSYQVMSASGLRVSELAGIAPNDCTLTDEGITFSFTAKGGKLEEVMLLALEHPKLYESLKKHIESIPSDKRVFYSAKHLQAKATELGFMCHDLRRAFAKLEYKKTKSKAKVMEKMRHSNIRNTKIYLRSKLKI